MTSTIKLWMHLDGVISLGFFACCVLSMQNKSGVLEHNSFFCFPVSKRYQMESYRKKFVMSVLGT